MDIHIINDLISHHHLTPTTITPVSGGWLNRKWKLVTPTGAYLVKQFSYERFSEEKLSHIESALRMANLVHEAGIPTPRMLSLNSAIIRRPAEGIAYMVMTWCEGETITARNVTPAQMRSLGKACGQMHRVFEALPCEGVLHYPLAGARVYETLSRHIAGLSDGSGGADGEINPGAWSISTKELLRVLDSVSPEYFDVQRRSVCHEDFSADNLLFSGDALSAIVDFDRVQYSYPLHDVGRALLSLAFDGNGLREEYVRAFADGYAVFRPLTADDTEHALRLTWCLEVPWWVHPGITEAASPKVKRFYEEMQFLTQYLK
ncbi:MAG: phosphotransferase [Clostridia bacterium]|nr:phosphotransferase [Clostridia bacterium]